MAKSLDVPPIYVVSLRHARERRRMIRDELNAVGLDFSFCDAVYGKKLSRKDQKLFSSFRTYKNMGRDLHPNEKGCFLSHLSIWNRMVERKIDEAIILEDDINVDQEFARVVSDRASWLPDKWGIVNFSWDTFGHHEFEEVRLIPGHEEYKVFRFPHSRYVSRTSGYMINLQAARILTESAVPIAMAADTYLGNYRNHRLDTFGIMPRLVTWGDQETTIIDDFDSIDEFAAHKRSTVKGLMYRLLIRLGV